MHSETITDLFRSGYLSINNHSDSNYLYNNIHRSIVCKEQNRAVDAARLIYVGSVNFSSYLETAEDRLN